jgi:hypothetical protein
MEAYFKMSKHPKLIFTLCILCGLIAACNLARVAQDPEENNTTSIWTQTAQVVQTQLPPKTVATDTPVSPTLTNTPITNSLTQNVPKKIISFRQGGTAKHIQEAIKNGEAHTYLVQASEGQTLILTVASPNDDVFLGVKGEQDGQELISTAAQSSYWVGTLPETQEYLVTLTTNNPDTYYFLTIEVPANIQFQPGSDSVSLEGYIDVDNAFHPDVMTRVRYLIHASEDQTMTIELNSPNLDNLSLGVSGQQDRQNYLSYHVKNNGGEVYLPVSQGYYIDVYSTGGVSTEFTLNISIK